MTEEGEIVERDTVAAPWSGHCPLLWGVIANGSVVCQKGSFTRRSDKSKRGFEKPIFQSR